MTNFRNKPIIFTKHALDRLAEANLDVNDAKLLLRRAGKKSNPDQVKWHKILKYGKVKADIYSNSQVEFTVREKSDQVLVITVTSFRTNKGNMRWVKRELKS